MHFEDISEFGGIASPKQLIQILKDLVARMRADLFVAGGVDLLPTPKC